MCEISIYPDMIHSLNNKYSQNGVILYFFSLHKSLSQEANLRDQFHNTLENYEGQIKHRDSIMDQAHKDNNQLVSQLKSALNDKAQMEAQVTKAQNSQRHLHDHNAKWV